MDITLLRGCHEREYLHDFFISSQIFLSAYAAACYFPLPDHVLAVNENEYTGLDSEKRRFKECEGKKADKSGHQESNHIRIYSYRLRSPPYLLISWPFSLVHSLERDFSFRVIRSTLPPWNPRLGQRVV